MFAAGADQTRLPIFRLLLLVQVGVAGSFGLLPLLLPQTFASWFGYTGRDDLVYRLAGAASVGYAVAALIGFLLWSKRATSASFFWGVLAGTGFVLSFDIVWVHWIFGLHHLTNTQMDLVLEPLLVLLGLLFLWFAITRERHQANKATDQRSR